MIVISKENKGEKGIQVKTTERDAHRDRQATVNLLSCIKRIHFYDFSTEL